jgi:hypothetical protein
MEKNHAIINIAVHLLLLPHTLFGTIEYTQKRNPKTVKSVVNLFLIHQNLFCVRESTLERNLTNIINETKPSILTQTLINIRYFMLERNYTNVRIVTNPSINAKYSESILVRTPTNFKEFGKSFNFCSNLCNHHKIHNVKHPYH